MYVCMGNKFDFDAGVKTHDESCRKDSNSSYWQSIKQKYAGKLIVIIKTCFNFIKKKKPQPFWNSLEHFL